MQRTYIIPIRLAVLSALLCPAVADAGGGEGSTELSVYGGYHVWSGDNELGTHEDTPLQTVPNNGPVFGLRVGQALTDRISTELEASFVPATTIETDLLPIADVNIFQGRIQGLFHLMTEDVRPFVLAGAGIASAKSNDQAVLHDDTDAYWHLGAGVKFDINDWFGLRLDAVLLLPPTTTGKGVTGDFEINLGPTFTFGSVPPGPDIDGDGLYNSVEDSLGTDPRDLDTDGDGIPDGDEDSEPDTLRTLDETAGGIRVVDTDGDGTPDALDPDDDDDTILTRVEREDTQSGNHDIDRDGNPAWLDRDSDGDNRPDSIELRGDQDGDGLLNYLDPDDSDGRKWDADGDGLINEVEAVLGTDPRNRDTDGDGLPDGEEDPDGDQMHNLAETLNGTATPDSDGDGIVDALDPLDDDGDGLPNAKDQCPQEPESVNGYKDFDGCPDELPEAVKKFSGAIQGITFDTDKDTIRASSFRVLGAAATVLKEFDDIRLEIEGHTDSQGDHQYNVDLSQRRAESVRLYLIGKGVTEDRLTARGFGPDVPVDDNATAGGRAKNRRVEFKIQSAATQP